MDLLTYFVIVSVAFAFDGVGVYFKASLFTSIGSMISLYGLAQLVSSGAIVLRTAYNGGFISSNASPSDYGVFVVVMVLIVTVSSVITIDLWSKAKGEV